MTRAALLRGLPAPPMAGSAKADVIAARMSEVNPDIRVLPVVGDLALDVGLGLLRRVDIVINRSLSPHFRPYIEAEAQPL